MEVLLAIVALAWAGFALLRVRDLKQRLERLERDLADRRSLERRSAPEPTPMPAAAPPPVPPKIERSPEPYVAPAPAPVRPPPPPIPAPPPRAPEKPAPRIEWERWLGVRGAAVLGGIFLAAAGVLFFQYSIEHGLITKEMRVALGVLAAVGCLVGGEVVRRRKYALTANAITGAGVVIFYAAFWSAHLLGIFPFGLSFALMVAVTALCCFLSWRNDSQLVAWLGLSGGFATPLLLSTGRDEPIALFSYMMLLDASFLFVANRKRWPLVGALGLLGTLVIQGAWFFLRMGPGTFAVGIVFLGAFALLFAFLSPKIVASDEGRGSERVQWLATRVGALLLPFAFAAQFAGRADVGYHLYPLILLSTLLGAASSWMARKQGATYAPLGAAAGASAIAFVWVLSNQLELARAWELVVCALISCAVPHIFCEWRRASAGEAIKGHDAALTVAVSGMAVALLGACFHVTAPNVWTLVAGFTLLPLFLLRLDALAPRTARPYLACIPACFAIAVWMGAHTGEVGFFERAGSFVPAMTAPIVFLAVAFLRKAAPARRTSFAACAVACLPLFATIHAWSQTQPNPSATFLKALALGICMALAASGARSGVLVGIAALVTALTQGVAESDMQRVDPADARSGVAVLLAGSAVFVLWPLVRKAVWKESRTIAWAAPAAAVFGLLPAMEMWRIANGTTGRAIPPAFYAALLVVAAALALRDRREEFRAERRADRTSPAVYGIHAVALASLFLGLALAQQLDRGIWTPTLAAACLGAALVWRKTDHAPLKYAALAAGSLAAASAFLTGLGDPHQTYGVPLLSGHGFDFFLPGAALVAAGLCAHALEVSRARKAEEEFYRLGWPWVSAGVGLEGLWIVLIWITVEVENFFAAGDHFALEFGNMPARDLSLSIAWASFAIVLLLVGMRRRIGVLRWVSLVLLLATIGKVFLLDLEDLGGLMRVGSFLGLAVSLLAVSLLYQRFVFKKETRPAA